MPPGGDGVYYFSIYLYVDDGEHGQFDMELNDDVICTTRPDQNSNGANDYAPGSCSVVVDVVAGNIYLKYIVRDNSSSVERNAVADPGFPRGVGTNPQGGARI